MHETLLDHRGLLDEGDDPHGSRTLGARQGIDFVHLLDEASTSSAERRAQTRFAAALETSLKSSRVEASSSFVRAFRRFPRFTSL
jgi:hypothetical protein